MVGLLGLISGLLLYSSFAPFALWWCAPIALALLIHVLHEPRWRRRFLAVTLFATAFFAPLLAWSNTYVGNIPWLILTILQIAFILPLALLSLDGTSYWRLLLFPSFWLLTESLRSRIPFGGFGWGRVAFAQADSPIAPVARLGGAPLLTFIVALISVGAYLAFSQRRIWVPTCITMIVVLLTFSAIWSRSAPVPRDFSVVAVQGGVPSLGLDFNSRATAVFENHLRATAQYLRNRSEMPDLILWPENAIDVDPFKNLEVQDELQKLTDEFGVPIIVGAVLEKNGQYQNSSVLWEPKAGATSIYIKRHLTPFGEYIPLRGIAEFVSPYARDVVDFLPGENIVIHRVGEAALAPIICFELLDDSLGRAMARYSNAMVVQTNSATFGLSAESEQQLGITRIRSIEHDRYSVSISTSGLSALIDPDGKVTHRTPMNASAVIDTEIALRASHSFSDRYGQQIEYLLLLPLVGFPIELALARRKKKP